MAENECTKCIHKEVCKTAESCDGFVSGCKHFKEQKKGRWIADGCNVTYAEKRRAIRIRERLIELLLDAFEMTDNELPTMEQVADNLIESGVTVRMKKPPADLSGKCGSCAYAKAEPDNFGRECYVRCRNAEHIAKHFRGKDISLRQRTTPACKDYKQKEGAGNG
jgi:hypothetical protein